MANDIQELAKQNENLNERLEKEIAERQRAEAALQQTREQFGAFLDTVPGGVSWVDANLKYLGANRHLASVFNLTPEAFVGQPIGFLHSSPEFAELVQRLFTSADETASQEVEMGVNGKSRTYLMTAQKFHQGEAAVCVGIDVTQRKQAEEQLLHDALHDRLTNLPNRTLFMDHLSLSIKRAKRQRDHSYAVLCVDLDQFKVVNDGLGHTIGDQLLIAIAGRLETCLRQGDTVARLGADEFAILLEDLNGLEDATQVADRIQRELALPFNVSGQDIFTAASIGIALGGHSYDEAEVLLRDADTAMHRAKALGKSRYELFNREMHAQVIHRLQVETELQRALKGAQFGPSEFEVHYQPIVELETDSVTGFEALVRWRHPQRGLIAPAEFIPVAEQTGLIVELDRWVLREACRQMHVWQKQYAGHPPLTISVNLSSKHFSHPDLNEQVELILAETGLAPGSLKLEITESAIIENAESAVTMLSKLKAMGIQLSMDDFGTGYSSLSYLHRFPLNTLKVDRSFVNRMCKGDRNTEIVRAIVVLARNLRMDVVAEGVETAEQMDNLRSLECQFGQGYFFSRPVDSSTAGAIIAREPLHQRLRA